MTYLKLFFITLLYLLTTNCAGMIVGAAVGTVTSVATSAVGGVVSGGSYVVGKAYDAVKNSGEEEKREENTLHKQ